MKLSLGYHFFGGAIAALGTEEHQKYLEGIDDGKILGCFAMTELGHGSNVKDVFYNIHKYH
jgi:acyl-CoA oxidase